MTGDPAEPALDMEAGGRLPVNMTMMEQHFVSLRNAPPALGTAFRSAIACVAAACPSAYVSQALVAGHAVVDTAERMALAGEDHPYHNRYHVAEAVLCMGWLSGLALEDGLLTGPQAVLGVLAMAGHDLGHDGSRCLDGRLEARSARLVRRTVEEAGLGRSAGLLVERVILASMPGGLPATRQFGTADPALTEPEQILCQLAREADVSASLLPVLGRRLTFALRREWRQADDPAAETLASFASRQKFLASNNPTTAAARRLGLAAITAMQDQAFAAVARQLDAGTDAAAGASALDQMSAIRARRLYGKTLDEFLSRRTPGSHSSSAMAPAAVR